MCSSDLKDRSYGFERRLVIIPFTKRIKETQMIRNLAANLIKEELSGIFTYAIEGLIRLRQNNFVFTKSRKAEKALEEYKEKIDPYLVFVRNYVKEDNDAARISVTDFRKHFQIWCSKEGHSSLKDVSAPTFSEQIQRVFRLLKIPYKRKKSGKRYLTGLKVVGLNATVEEDDDIDYSPGGSVRAYSNCLSCKHYKGQYQKCRHTKRCKGDKYHEEKNTKDFDDFIDL